MKNPKISVVMSVYNSAKFIKTAVQSILNQTYTDFEFIIINDGSTDKSMQIIESFADERIVLIDKAQNDGLIAALNDGLEAVKGEYIARMDADDESLPERFKLQIEFMQNHPETDILGTAMFFIDGNKIRIIKPKETHAECLNALFGGVCIMHPTVMIRKTALDKIKYNEKYKTAEDYKLWVDLAKNGAKFANLQVPLFKYNWHGENISIAKQKQQMTNSKLLQKEYLLHFLSNDISKDLTHNIDLFFDEKITNLYDLSTLHKNINLTKKPAILKLFRAYIRDNISVIQYHFSDKVSSIFLLYLLRYKIKKWFK